MKLDDRAGKRCENSFSALFYAAAPEIIPQYYHREAAAWIVSSAGSGARKL
jgi:hypothetical protein